MSNSQIIKRPIGRFAPSPTGHLHFGSLVTAVASYCLAKQDDGLWLVRMEDLDKAREVPGAADLILRQLESIGLYWDGSVVYQSQRSARYAEITTQLEQLSLTFPCNCSRKQLAVSAPHFGVDGPIYPGTCLRFPPADNHNSALRLKTNQQIVSFSDLLQGKIKQNIAQEVGDFILRRRDGVFAYQLAVVVDDHDSGITQIVRGRDLLASTPRQIYLARQLGFAQPSYCHLPLALNNDGVKISKRHHQIDQCSGPSGSDLLYNALIFLGQSPPQYLKREQPPILLSWAVANFNFANIPKQDQRAKI